MHGSLQKAEELMAATPGMSAAALEKPSGRSALHKAAFWGHDKMLAWLCKKAPSALNLQDYDGDTALHDAVGLVDDDNLFPPLPLFSSPLPHLISHTSNRHGSATSSASRHC